MRRLMLASVAGLIALLCVIGSHARPTGATFPGRDGKIAFVKAGGIFVINPDGSGQIQLTQTEAVDASPAWSPDGSKIAFESNRDANREGNFNIYVMNADGSGITNLTRNGSPNEQPDWSPDGSQIIFSSRRDGRNNDLFVMNADGSNPHRITDNPDDDSSPHWSPDGHAIAFISRREPQPVREQLYVTRDNATTLIPSGMDSVLDADWSPDGTMLAFTLHGPGGNDTPCGSVIAIANADGTDFRRITSGESCDREPHWAPDGRSIAFLGNAEIKVMNPDGTNQRTLSHDTFGARWLAWQPRAENPSATSAVSTPTPHVGLPASGRGGSGGSGNFATLAIPILLGIGLMSATLELMRLSATWRSKT